MLKMRLVAAVMMAGTLVLPAWDTSTQTMAGGLQTPPIVTATEAPAGTVTLDSKAIYYSVGRQVLRRTIEPKGAEELVPGARSVHLFGGCVERIRCGVAGAALSRCRPARQRGSTL
jgi:hypothetical protein